jgi:hypothetical protein
MDHSGATVLVTVPQLIPNAREANLKVLSQFASTLCENVYMYNAHNYEYTLIILMLARL